MFDGSRALALLEKQCSFGPRVPGSESHRQCVEWLSAHLQELGGEVHLQRFDGVNPHNGKKVRLTNVIARFDGGDGPPLMLCAHWDSRPVADRDPDPRRRGEPILGANDGASGVAILLEIARLVGQTPPPRPVLIVLFDGEDMGREGHPEEYATGARYWATHQQPEPPAEAILLDMVGDRDLEIPIEPFSEVGAPQLRRGLYEIARRIGVDAFVEQLGPAVEDDHVPLLRAGIPAVDLIDFDYPYWHTLGDTPDKCSAESLMQVGRVLAEYLYR